MKVFHSLCKLDLEGERNPGLFKELWDKGAKLEDLCLLLQRQFLDQLESKLNEIDKNFLLESYFDIKTILTEASFFLAASLKAAPMATTAPLMQAPPLVSLLKTIKRLSEKLEAQIPAVKREILERTKLWIGPGPKIERFSPEAIHEISAFMLWIRNNCHHWIDILIAQGKDTYFPAAPIPFIFTVGGDCILLFQSESQMLGIGSIKEVFPGWSGAKAELVAVIKSRSYSAEPSPEKENKARYAFLRTYAEYLFLRTLRGKPGIIPCYAMFAFKIDKIPEVFLIEPLYSPKNLAFWIGDKLSVDSSYPPSFEAPIAHYLLKGLQAIHQAKIIHRSIKVENVLLNEEDPPKAFIIDFEEAADENDLVRRTMRRPLIHFLPPEYCAALLNPSATNEDLIQVNSYAYDVWALGIVFYQFFKCSLLPWADMTKEEMKHVIVKFPFSTWVEEEFSSHWALPLMKKMLEPDPDKRATIDQAVAIFTDLMKNMGLKRVE
ncbi:MAG: protein kinase [Verrucomicrobia bacterium]|nr:protein kinase [Verrucomicrobiota bacterium]